MAAVFSAAFLTPSMAAGPLFATRDEAEAALFVLEAFLDDDADVEKLRSLYADSVQYFDMGQLERSKVIALKKDFISRWSRKFYFPDLSTLLVKRDGEHSFAVKVEVDFKLESVATDLEGRSLVDVTLARQGRNFLIIREAGKIILQKE
jgi:hypothetical protein